MRTINDLLQAPVYNELIPDEIEKPSSYQCFPGAWYYKALSSKDYWLGIEVTITLPEFTADEKRYDFIKDSIIPTNKTKRYKDTPSIYLGGSSDAEVDAGLGWFRGLVEDKVPEEKFTYRPFYRYIYLDDTKVERNIYSGPSIKETQYYYFPGDTVRIHLFSPQDNYLQMQIELLSETKIKKYCEIRKKLSQKPQTYLTEMFTSFGNGYKKAEYKRVNAIDQYGNESKPTQMTNAYVSNAKWTNCYLFRNVNGKLVKVPFNSKRYIQMKCPDDRAFTINTNGLDEEVIIDPNKCLK